MKALQPTDYMYASARLRALENRLVGRARLETLIDAGSSEEVLERLGEYGIRLPEDAPTGAARMRAREAMLAAALREAYAEVEDAVPDPALFRYFRYPYDGNNLKAAIKCGMRGVSVGDLLSDCGTVPADEVEALVREGKLDRYPPVIADAVATAREAYARTGDPRRIDTIVDRAVFAAMLADAAATGDKTLHGWMRARIDLLNILICLRILRMEMGIAGEALLEEALLAGGTLGERFFTEAYTRGEAGLAEALIPTEYNRLLSTEGEPVALSTVERAADDCYMTLVRDGARIPFGAPIAGGYLIGCEGAVKNIRIVLAAKDAGLSADTLRERIRVSYV